MDGAGRGRAGRSICFLTGIGSERGCSRAGLRDGHVLRAWEAGVQKLGWKRSGSGVCSMFLRTCPEQTDASSSPETLSCGCDLRTRYTSDRLGVG